MWAALVWLGKAAAAVVSWAWAHPVAAVIVGVAVIILAEEVARTYPVVGTWLAPLLSLVGGSLLLVGSVRSLLPSAAHIPWWTRVVGAGRVWQLLDPAAFAAALGR